MMENNSRVTGRRFQLLMIDWAIECCIASDNKKHEMGALLKMGMESFERGDNLTTGVIREKHSDAQDMAGQFKGESYGYLLASRIYASGHNVMK